MPDEPKKREKFQAMKAAVQRKRDEQAAKPKVMPSADTVKLPSPPAPALSTWTAKSKKQRPPRKPFQADAEIHQKGRFPAQSYFHNLLWNGTVWKTALLVPHVEPGEPAVQWKEFAAEDTALHRLLVRLYAEYRKWADAQPKEVPSADAHP